MKKDYIKNFKQGVAFAIVLCLVLGFSGSYKTAQEGSVVVNNSINAKTQDNTNSLSSEINKDNSIIDVVSTTPEEALTTQSNESTETPSQNKDTTSIIPKSAPKEISNVLSASTPVKNQPTFAPITPIRLNNTLKDFLTKRSDVRTYSFSVSERGYIEISLSHDNKADASKDAFRATLFEEYISNGLDGDVLYRELGYVSSAADGSVPVVSSKMGVLPGRYRVVVRAGDSFSLNSYGLKVSFTKSADYEWGFNNTITRYNEIALNKNVNGCMNLKSTPDTDWFMFKVTKAGRANILFAHEEIQGLQAMQVGWRITLCDAKENEIYFARSTFGDLLVDSGAIGLDVGTYFIKIEQHVFSSMEYTLLVNFTEDPLFEGELNDTPETADTLLPNTLKRGSLSPRSAITDRDYYKFKLLEPGFVVLDFTHTPLVDTKDGWNIKILDKNNTLLYSATSKWSDAVISSPAIGLASGEYYVLIDSENRNFNNLVYSLYLNYTQDNFFEAEPNDTRHTANPIFTNTSYKGALVEVGINYDTDWFEFTLDSKKLVSITFSHIAQPFDREGWIVKLVNSNGGVVDTMTSKWNEATKSNIPMLLEAGTYYVSVETGTFYSNINYEVKVNATTIS